ncbi:MAG: hypothetical protein ACOX2F_11420 [bacterium]
MKRLLMVTLLFLATSAFISCNSYRVEGKPEVASDPAKKIFAHYPWDDQSKDPSPGDTEEPGDKEESDNEVSDDVPEIHDDAETPDDAEISDDNEVSDDEAVLFDLKSSISKTLTQEFEIYNRGETGELIIWQINLIDPRGHKIAELDNKDYRELFELQLQSMTDKGIASEGWDKKNPTYYNTIIDDAQYKDSPFAPALIAPLCPLDRDKGRVCKKGFSDKEYNSHFKLLLSYNKDAAEKLKDKPPQDMEDNPLTHETELKYKLDGDFWIEVCSNDPTKDPSDTCGKGTSYKIQVTRQPNKPPKPIIKVKFDHTTGGEMSYRNIKDKVYMDLSNTCVSDPKNPDVCLDKAFYDKNEPGRRYAIKYKWEMKESPTPLIEESQLKLTGVDIKPGQWILDVDNPERGEFKGLMITPRRYAEKNTQFKDDATCQSECGSEPKDTADEFYFLKLSDYLICRQKHCEEFRTRYYKINIQAETVDLETDLVSDTADITVVPKIIPQARVVAQLTWKQGYRTKTEMDVKEGVKIDIDIHMIKKSSLEAATYNYSPLEGVLGTNFRNINEDYNPGNAEHEKYFRHDDCSFSDQGIKSPDIETIAWHASLDIDNTWGGNNFETPETIGLGPIEDKNGDGIPDDSVMDDQYLIVVGYVSCMQSRKYTDGLDRCSPGYQGEDSAYEVDVRVDVLVDGVEAPRKERIKDGNNVRPADNYSATTKNFKIKHSQWKVVAAVKWDNSLPGPETNPKYPGDAIVSDIAMPSEEINVNPSGYKTCTFDFTDAVLVPVWDENQYYQFLNRKVNEEDPSSDTIGYCE